MTTFTASPLSGVRIWLSASIPRDASPDETERLTKFIRTLAPAAFREGARILHGVHPSITASLLETAREYKTATNRKAPLSLLVSTYFRDPANGGYGQHSVNDIEQDCELQQIPKAENEERSLSELRNNLASQADVLIAIGGKWWREDRGRAGVPAEFNLAITRGIPVFLLGGLGGATSGYLKNHPEILTNLRNGLDAADNSGLASETDVDTLVQKLLDQIGRLPLGRRETAAGQRFRILCLDGGGIRGAFTAAVLAQWEQMSNLHAADHFDLIAGTSTGGLLAIGLGLGLTAQNMVDFYRDEGPEIFPMTGWAKRILLGAIRIAANKFDASVLEKKLGIAYDRFEKPATLGDSPHRLLITSYNLTTNALGLYRTSHHPDVQGHDHLRAVVVARATAAAPTYFRPAQVEERIAQHEAVDGGIWANCPALAALGEAVGVLKIPLDRIEMLSVGTAGLPTLVDGPPAEGMLGWSTRAPDLFMNAQMDATLLYMEQVLGNRFVRIDDDRPRLEIMDDPSDLDFLIGRGASIGEKTAPRVLSRFLNGVHASTWRAVRAAPPT